MILKISKPIVLITSILMLTACGGSGSSDTVSADSILESEPASLDLSDPDNSYLLTTTEDSIFKISAADGAVELFSTLQVGGALELLGPVDVVDGSVIVSLTNNFLVSANPDTRAANWETQLGPTGGSRSIPSAPVCSSTVCYVLGAADILFAINAIDGSVLWSVPLGAPDIASEVTGQRPMLVTTDRIFIGIDFESTQRLNVYSRSSGELLKSIELSARASGVPSVFGDSLILSTLDGIDAFDFNTYELRWRADIGFATSPVIVDETIVVLATPGAIGSTDTGQIAVGLDVETGEVKWSFSNGGPRFLNPTTDGRLVYIMFPTGLAGAGFTSELAFPRAINPANGSIVWQVGDFQDARSRALVGGEPLAVPGYLFFNDFLEENVGSGFAALDSNTGAALWVISDSEYSVIDRESTTSVLVHEGQVFRNNSFPTLPK